MKYSNKPKSIIKYKLLYTLLIIAVYLLGKGIPLYRVDISKYLNKTVNMEALLVQAISGDVYQCSLFALGISPFMISAILVQIIVSGRKNSSGSKISPSKMNRISLILTAIIAIFQAVTRVQELQFSVAENMLVLAKSIAAVEMVAGSMLILWLTTRNKKYGIGGQTAIILVNIIDGIRVTLQNNEIRQWSVPILLSLMVMAVMIIMENSEKRIPLQRISIHNIYADKNYLAIKFNPIGVMPVMFSMAFFMLPQMLISWISQVLPENAEVLWLRDNIILSRLPGVIVYIVILYCLTIGFSRVFVNPDEITDQFLKSGDSIQNIHAGRDTKKYLSRVITGMGVFSATAMSICLGAPMIMQLTGGWGTTFTTLPSSVMMLTGVSCNLYKEIKAIKNLEAYKPFL